MLDVLNTEEKDLPHPNTLDFVGFKNGEKIDRNQELKQAIIGQNTAKINDILKEEAKNVMYNPRLVVVGDSFHKYDGHSISKLPYNVELVSLNLYNKEFVLIDKKYVSRNLDITNLKLSDVSVLENLVNLAIKLLESAIANAENNNGMDPSKLYIAECYANCAPTMKRVHPRAQGRAYRILKRMSHITIVLNER